MVESAIAGGYGDAPAAGARHPTVGPLGRRAPTVVGRGRGGRRRGGHGGRRRDRPGRWAGGGRRRVVTPPRAAVARPALVAGRCRRPGATRRGTACGPTRLGPFHGWATVVGDPQRVPGADAGRRRGRRRALRGVGARPRRASARRRRGRPATGCGSPASAAALDAERAGDASPGSTSSASSTPTGSATCAPGGRLADASNRVRAVIARGAGAPARRPGRADPGPRHRRRPRPAAGDGRALPRQRACRT